MRTISYSGQFSKDVKRAKRRGKDMQLLLGVMQLLIDALPLPKDFHDHALKGNWKPFRDLHIQPDWLLIYIADDEHVHFDRTGTHSDLFGN